MTKITKLHLEEVLINYLEKKVYINHVKTASNSPF